MRYVGETFENATINLDGNQFEGCTFVKCRIIYTAADTFSIDGCTFVTCDWLFDGAAERTLYYLSALYRGLGPPAQELVDVIFQQIKEGRIGQETMLPSALAAS